MSHATPSGHQSVRVGRDQISVLRVLARAHSRSVAGEIRAAISYWIDRFDKDGRERKT